MHNPMDSRSYSYRFIAGLAFVTLTCMPGCIVGQIRDELVAVNASLDRANLAFSESNQQLQEVRADLRRVIERFAAVEQHLVTTDDRLKALDAMAASVKTIDAHMASLRQTVENVDKRIPFVEFADDRPVSPAPEQPKP